MPVDDYLNNAFFSKEPAFKGELVGYDYIAKFAATNGSIKGYEPTVELVYPEGLIRSSKESDVYIARVEREVAAYFTQGPINQHEKARYKKYAGGPFYVSSGHSGIYIFFLNASDQSSFLKAMHGSFQARDNAMVRNVSVTLDRALKHQFQPQNERLRDLYNALRAESGAIRPEVAESVSVDFPGATMPEALPAELPTPAVIMARRAAGRQVVPA